MKIGLQLAMPSEFRALPGASSLTPFETAFCGKCGKKLPDTL